MLIPIISAGLYLAGGQINKWFRWGMGIPIGLLAWHGVWYWALCKVVLCFVAYLAATNWMSYGDDSWTSKIFGRWASMGIAGLAYGLASIVVLGPFWGVIQGIIGCVAFLVIKYYDDKGVIHNPIVELARGGLGTILMGVI